MELAAPGNQGEAARGGDPSERLVTATIASMRCAPAGRSYAGPRSVRIQARRRVEKYQSVCRNPSLTAAEIVKQREMRRPAGRGGQEFSLRPALRGEERSLATPPVMVWTGLLMPCSPRLTLTNRRHATFRSARPSIQVRA